jgi:hypothetical protein
MYLTCLIIDPPFQVSTLSLFSSNRSTPRLSHCEIALSRRWVLRHSKLLPSSSTYLPYLAYTFDHVAADRASISMPRCSFHQHCCCWGGGLAIYTLHRAVDNTNCAAALHVLKTKNESRHTQRDGIFFDIPAARGFFKAAPSRAFLLILRRSRRGSNSDQSV